MRISVSTRHGHLAQETQNKISQKLEKLARFHDKIGSAEVTIDLKDGGDPSIEVKLSVDGTPGFSSHTQGSNLLGAVDGAVHKLEEQLKRHKKKLIDHHRDSARRHAHEMPLGDSDEDDVDDDID